MSEILSIIDVNDYGIQSMVAGGADLQEKTATPTTLQQVIQADEGYDGLSSVTVNAVTSAIDENIIPTNIRTGKTILGVQGNLEPDKPDQSKTVTPSTVQQVIRADTGYELAQVTVEAVPDETPELNAQDTALSNQETVIGQLSSALDDKIALDLQAATSDANATANDIAQNKTAYVNGVKLTGVAEPPEPDWSEIGYSGVPQEVTNGFNIARIIMQDWTVKSDYSYELSGYGGCIFMPLVDTSNAIIMGGMLYACYSLITVPLLNTSNVTNMESMFGECSALLTIPQFDTSNVINMSEMFVGCRSLITVPLLNTSNVTNMESMFGGCDVLSDESLNNVLAMCIGATSYTGTKTLVELGLSQTQATTCQTLSNWDAFVAAGWSTGY